MKSTQQVSEADADDIFVNKTGSSRQSALENRQFMTPAATMRTKSSQKLGSSTQTRKPIWA